LSFVIFGFSDMIAAIIAPTAPMIATTIPSVTFSQSPQGLNDSTQLKLYLIDIYFSVPSAKLRAPA
jgi:hypothetical protein